MASARRYAAAEAIFVYDSSDEDAAALVAARRPPSQLRTNSSTSSLASARGNRKRKGDIDNVNVQELMLSVPHASLPAKKKYGRAKNVGRDDEPLVASQPPQPITPAATPTKFTARPNGKSKGIFIESESINEDLVPSTPSRSTRSSGQGPLAYVPLLGAPSTSSLNASSSSVKSTAPKRRVKATSYDSEASRSTRSPTKSTPTKRSRSSPARQVVSEGGSDDDDVAENILPNRGNVVQQLPTPKRTPKKKSTVTPSRASPSKKEALRPNTPSRVRTISSLETEGSDDDDDDEEDELLLGPPVKTPSPKKKRVADTVTLRRSSTRAQRLPIAQADIDATPQALRSRLVGWHMEDLPASEEPETQSPLRRAASTSQLAATCSTARTALPTRDLLDHSQLYSKRSLSFLLGRITRTLNGWMLPKPPRLIESFDKRDAMAYPYLPGGTDQWEKPLRYAMNGVVQQNVGNCLIVLGPRGVGKTTLFERTMRVLEKAHGKDSFIVVRLNGLVHTTDRLAMRSIASQLKSKGFSDDEGDFGSNAATMTTLLRMLEPANDPRSVADKPIIILVDEFDLFAQHPRQSFLYSLLDIVQGNRRKAGMGVVGLSARSDCLSILEKRVRSRCQSQVHQMVLRNDLEDYLSMARQVLCVDSTLYHEFGDAEMGTLANEWNEEVGAFLEDPVVSDHLERIWSIHGNNPARLLQTLLPLANHCESMTRRASDKLTVPHLTYSMFNAEPKSGHREDLPLDHLTILDLTVCIAAKHMRAHYDNVINVELLYRCYLEHVQRGKLTVSAKPWTRLAFRMSFDRLRALEIFLPWTGKPMHYVSPSQSDGFKSFRFVPWDSTLNEAIRVRNERSKDVPEPLRKWLKSQDA